jgi:hypothetical protein
VLRLYEVKLAYVTLRAFCSELLQCIGPVVLDAPLWSQLRVLRGIQMRKYSLMYTFSGYKRGWILDKESAGRRQMDGHTGSVTVAAVTIPLDRHTIKSKLHA